MQATIDNRVKLDPGPEQDTTTQTETRSRMARLGQWSSGVALILAPLFLLISNLLQSRGYSDKVELLADIARRPVANELSFAFALYGFVLFIPAAMGLLHLFRSEPGVLGHVGAALLVLGMVSFAFIAGTEAILFLAGADGALDRAALIAINDRLGESIVYNIVNLTEVFGYLLGTIFVAVTLYRTRLVPRAIALMLLAAILIRFSMAGFYFATVLADVLYSLAFGYVGYTILKMDDTAWECL